MTHLLLTVHFLDDCYHGLLDSHGPPEWPPSPFRLFCALVAGVARRGELECNVGKALAWLQKLHPPIIIAPKAKTGQAIMRFVPNNDADKKPDRQERLTRKPTIPTLMLLKPNEKAEVHYLWEIDGRMDVPMHRLRDAARTLTTLGWGIDMAFADAGLASETDVQGLKGVRWYPKPGAWRDVGMLRVPTVDIDLHEDTLSDLKHCHQTAMERIEHGKPLHSADKPRVFEPVFYASAERPIGRPTAVFELRHDDGSFCAYSQRKLVHIAGMVRHLAKTRRLIEAALVQSGIEQSCTFEWSAFSCFRKSFSAHKYDRDKRPTGYIRPDHLLTQTAVHLTLRPGDGLKIFGPLAIVAGRHCGLGVFASAPENE